MSDISRCRHRGVSAEIALRAQTELRSRAEDMALDRLEPDAQFHADLARREALAEQPKDLSLALRQCRHSRAPIQRAMRDPLGQHLRGAVAQLAQSRCCRREAL